MSKHRNTCRKGKQIVVIHILHCIEGYIVSVNVYLCQRHPLYKMINMRSIKYLLHAPVWCVCVCVYVYVCVTVALYYFFMRQSSAPPPIFILMPFPCVFRITVVRLHIFSDGDTFATVCVGASHLASLPPKPRILTLSRREQPQKLSENWMHTGRHVCTRLLSVHISFPPPLLCLTLLSLFRGHCLH